MIKKKKADKFWMTAFDRTNISIILGVAVALYVFFNQSCTIAASYSYLGVFLFFLALITLITIYMFFLQKKKIHCACSGNHYAHIYEN